MEYYIAIKNNKHDGHRNVHIWKIAGIQGVWRQQFQVNVRILMRVRSDFRETYLVYGISFSIKCIIKIYAFIDTQHIKEGLESNFSFLLASQGNHEGELSGSNFLAQNIKCLDE